MFHSGSFSPNSTERSPNFSPNLIDGLANFSPNLLLHSPYFSPNLLEILFGHHSSVDDHDLLIFDDHLPGKCKDLITVYDLHTRACLMHREEYTERTYNGEKSVTVNKDGRDIIIF